jgi:hypothetical protein
MSATTKPMIGEIRRLLNEQGKAMMQVEEQKRSAVAGLYGYEIEKLQEAAQKTFATLNGWIVTKTANDAEQSRELRHGPGGMWLWGQYVGDSQRPQLHVPREQEAVSDRSRRLPARQQPRRRGQGCCWEARPGGPRARRPARLVVEIKQ